MDKIRIAYYNSPVGAMILGSYRDRLCLSDWMSGNRRGSIDSRICRCLNARYEVGMSEVIENTILQLDEYFSGKRIGFTVPLQFAGTEFQNRVWSELQNIPYGETISYAEEARRVGNPKSVRAVASANAVNALSIIIPCHRVIGSNNKLTGYGGGLDTKLQLLQLEAEVCNKILSSGSN